MHAAREVFRRFEFLLYEGLIDDEFRFVVPEATLFPCFDLMAHRLEIALHAIDADRDSVYEAEVFRVLREYGAEISLKRHVVADEYAITDCHRKAHGLVVRVSDADRETAS